MKYKLTFIIILIHFLIDAQEKDSSAMSFKANYISDFGRNFTGGVKPGNFYMGMMNISVDIPFFKRCEFYAQIQNTHGAIPTVENIGDLQVFSNIQNGDFTYLYMLWLKFTLGKFYCTLGIHDLNTEMVINNSYDKHDVFAHDKITVLRCIPCEITKIIVSFLNIAASLN